MRPIRAGLLALALACCCVCNAAAQTVVIVRHAEKADSSADPDLSEEGRSRAVSLAELFEDEAPGLILTSPLQRTMQTAVPASGMAGVPIQTVSFDGGTEDHVMRTVGLVRAASPETVILIVGHSNTVPQIAAALGDQEPQSLGECDFDRVTTLVLGPAGDAPTVTHSRYGAPSVSC
ncbi:phosphoglycerate mutase family protein [Brevundimonas sp.]|uniref:SixA phosphatase family protein n=1 Tax=Brevundimonas sp. TaxID=1871086 RepID=UPI002AB8AF09|nr:phosphoglycerate mutase family protein [Brevundimonas sp.]MDZ4361893.1 phosphoglycerate mutase family protein [Brevundimonas sp.]